MFHNYRDGIASLPQGVEVCVYLGMHKIYTMACILPAIMPCISIFTVYTSSITK